MRAPLGLFAILAVIMTLVTRSARRLDASSDLKSERPDFSGTWKLNEKLSTDPFEKIQKDGSSRRGSTDTGALEIPVEALEMDQRLVTTDEGQKIRVTRGNGRERTLFLDGEERELDDGDGPAKVIAKRKGGHGEKIAVSSRWGLERDVQETWEIQSGPRRLVITTQVRGRHPFNYKRTYEPAPPETPFTPPAAPSPPPDPAAR